MKEFELIDHTADLKLRVYGTSLEQLFINALKGMFQSVHPLSSFCTSQEDTIVCTSLPKKHTITLDSPDTVSLLVDFLSEALYLSDVHNEAYLDAKINILTATHLESEIFGIPIERFRDFEIKAVTYHDLSITHTKGIWQTDIVFDI